MTVQTREARGWTGGRRRVLAALLAVAILIPLGVLFLRHNGDLGEGRSMATQERHGIEYLLALSQLTIALTDAQSAAVSGEPVSREVLDAALADVADVNDRFGEELRVHERWSQLRDTIELAAGTDHADGRAAYTAYAEATGLLLGLHDRLRETTGLVRDPDQDAYHLQDAAGGRLPETIVAAGRLVDLVTLAAGEPASQQAANTMEISAAVTAVTGHADDLVTGIQAMLDSTRSSSLSSSILGQYDRFLRAKDGLLLAVPPEGNVQAVDFELLGFISAELPAATDDLFTALLTELDTLVETRLSELTRDRWTAIALLCAGLLLALGVVGVSLARGTRPTTTRHRRPSELTAGSGGDGLGDGSGSGRPGTPQLSPALTPLSDTAAGYESGRRRTAPAGDPLAGELLGSERGDVR
jgi:hypothetical protein